MNYPSSIKRPLIIFVTIIILLIAIAILFCRLSKQNVKQTLPIEPVEVIIQENKPLAIETSPEIKEEVVVKEIKPEVNRLILIKKDFIDKGIISNNFTNKSQIFFDKNKYKTKTNEFNKNFNKEIEDSELIIITGYACDLGSEEFNNKLIQKRINFILNNIKNINPSVEIIFSNEGQIKTLGKNKTEKERRKERRIDMYFYK